MKHGSQKRKAQRVGTKVAAGIVSLTIAVTVTTGIAYADVDTRAALQAWFNKKTSMVMADLEQSVQSETDKQKALLKDQLQLRLETSSRQLDEYTEDQKRRHAEAIEQHANALIANLTFNNEQDRQQIQAKLEAITVSAMAAMDGLAESYVQPVLTFTPSVNPTVTDAVYGQ